MTVEITKGTVVTIEKTSAQPAGPKKFYFGLGWAIGDESHLPKEQRTDLDLVLLPLRGGKAGSNIVKDLVFFNNRAGFAGIELSEDARDGEKEGDDESVVIDTAKLDPTIDGIVIGIVSWKGKDFSEVANPHIRGCDGGTKDSPQVFEFPIRDSAFPGDTVLVVARLQKTPSGWALKAEGVFHALGQGSPALHGFFNLFPHN